MNICPSGGRGEGGPDMTWGTSAEEGGMFTNSGSAGPDSLRAGAWRLRLRGASSGPAGPPRRLGATQETRPWTAGSEFRWERASRVGCGGHTGRSRSASHQGGLTLTGESDAAVTVMVGGRKKIPEEFGDGATVGVVGFLAVHFHTIS